MKTRNPWSLALVAIAIFVAFIVAAILYDMGFNAGVKSVKAAPIATQAQRIKTLESTVEKLVNNEQIPAETAMKLDALETEVLDHIESHVDTITIEGTATP